MLPHPDDPDRVLVAMSTGGVYVTEDGGDSGARATPVSGSASCPSEYPEFGQCVHKVDRSPPRPDQLFLQNHGGVYRSDDGGGDLAPVEVGLPATFGFPVVRAPAPAGDGVRLPAASPTAYRLPPGGTGRVYRTNDGARLVAAVRAPACPRRVLVDRPARRVLLRRRRPARPVPRHPHRRGLGERRRGRHLVASAGVAPARRARPCGPTGAVTPWRPCSCCPGRWPTSCPGGAGGWRRGRPHAATLARRARRRWAARLPALARRLRDEQRRAAPPRQRLRRRRRRATGGGLDHVVGPGAEVLVLPSVAGG